VLRLELVQENAAEKKSRQHEEQIDAAPRERQRLHQVRRQAAGRQVENASEAVQNQDQADGDAAHAVEPATRGADTS
jgi:hypothetical protein